MLGLLQLQQSVKKINDSHQPGTNSVAINLIGKDLEAILVKECDVHAKDGKAMLIKECDVCVKYGGAILIEECDVCAKYGKAMLIEPVQCN